MESLPFFCFISSFIFLSCTKLSLAVDTISPGKFIRDGETLVSSSQTFELGFFSPGNSKNLYLGIWYKKSPEMVVWVANRNNPIIDPHGFLTISNTGNLVLLNETKGMIWASNVSREVENPVATLLDTGNLVVMDNFSRNSGSYIWQSFDYPSDTLLPGMKLGWDLNTGLERYLTSWRSADDPSPGNFTCRLDRGVLPQISLYRRSEKMSRLGVWTGDGFGYNDNFGLSFEKILVQDQEEIYYMYKPFNNPIIMLLKLNQSGKLERLMWKERSSQWNPVYTVPGDFCQYYGNCGANSVCSNNKTPICDCLKGFKQKSQPNQTLPKACVSSSPSDCKAEDRFEKLSGFKWPDLLDVSLNESMNFKECEAECLKNCSCRAYTNSNVTGGGNGCLMWFGDLIDVGKARGMDLYVRVPASELGNKKLGWVIVIVVAAMVLISTSFAFCFWRRKVKGKETEEVETIRDMLLFDFSVRMGTSANELCNGDRKGKTKDAWLPLFSFASVSAATNNFSTENKLGEGGFGSVYKGMLHNGREVAVKRLSRQSLQGLEELKNETKLIAKLQHRNLVRILGCCIEQGEKILIYEYLPNKSLDSFLFDPIKKGILDSKMRVKIIEGIAQGLLYLHQYSRLRIIHRDLKASNILLDSNMNPKISNFGLARIFGDDKLQANTNRIVGTFGYMSPEYVLQGLFSMKSDVFSFGVLLLEIVSGKKNTGFYQSDTLNLLGYAWKLWIEERALDLMDPVLINDTSYPILTRYINVALLCVQETAADRPTMSEVVSMLTNELLPLPSPKQPAFWYMKSSQNSIPPTNRTQAWSINEITISEMEAR